MKKRIAILSGFAIAALVACGNDSSSSTNSENNGGNPASLPDTVATLDELLQNYPCSATYKCAHVYLTEWNNVMECDGEAWAYLSEYTKSVCGYGSSSSSSDVGESSSSSAIEPVSSFSVTDVASSSSAVEGSSSSAAEDQCEAMDKEDITTWHFVRNDAFGDPITYTYSINTDGQIVLTTKESDGTEKSKVLYQKSTSIYIEYAYSGAKSTCEDKE